MLDNQPTDTEVVVGRSVLLNCTARGLPEPVITWTKNGEPVDFDDGRIQILENGSLFFSRVNISDSGDYKCNASNDLGFDDADDAMLMVNSKFNSIST